MFPFSKLPIPAKESREPSNEKGSELLTAAGMADAEQREEETRKSDADRYQTLVENLPVGVYRNTAGPKGHFLEVNPALVAMTEAGSKEELLTHSVSDLYQKPEDRGAFAEKLMKNGFVKDEELNLVTLKGKKIIASVTAMVGKDIDGNAYFYGTVEDITERKQLEASLQESVNRYRALFISSRDAVMTIEPPLWHFTSGNPAAIKMFAAKDEQEFMQQTPWSLSPSTQADGRSSEEEAKEMIATAMNEGSKSFEWMHKRLEGDAFPAEVLLSKVEQNSHTYLHALVRDITERKELEKQIAEYAEEKFKVIYDNATDGMVLADASTHALSSPNAAFCRMIGYSEEELAHMKVMDLHPSEDVPHVLDEFGRQQRKEIVVSKDLRVKRKDGSIFFCDISATPIMLQGQQYVLGIFRDVTERKDAEEKEAAYVAELKQMNRLMIDRELKMVELKGQIEELKGKANVSYS